RNVLHNLWPRGSACAGGGGLMDSVVQTQDLDKMVYFDDSDAVLYVSKNHAFHAQVRSFMQQLRKKTTQFQVQQVAMDVIQEKRARRSDVKDEGLAEPSEMQRQATEMFRKAVALRASDIHIRVAYKQGITKVYFRVHNDLELQAD